VTLRAFAFAAAAVGAIASAAVVASTLVPGGPLAPHWVIWPLFAGCIAINAETARAFASRRTELTQRLRETPRPLFLIAAAVFALSMQAVLTSHGSPERRGHAYYLRNHTELTLVSRAEFRYAERKEERLFAGVALVFYLAALIALSPPGWAGRETVTGPTRAQPTP
jgi:hypothetical protein